MDRLTIRNEHLEYKINKVGNKYRSDKLRISEYYR